MMLRYARVLASLTLLIGCSQPKATSKPTPESVPMMPSPPPLVPDDAVNQNGLTWSVHATETTEPAREAGAHAPATQLDAKATERVLARLPKLEADPAQQQAFALRGKSLAPPTSGSTKALPFPAAETKAPPAPKAPVVPLTVRRFGPVGDVPLAAQVGITFSQPMIEVSTVDQAASKTPVKLSPAVEGNWRWMGTQTLVFAPAERLPMATAFTAEIPKGTKSINGGVLADAVKWTFATSPLTLQNSTPRDSSGVGLAPLIFMGFDQRINAKALLAHITVKAGRFSSVAMRAATQAEIDSDGSVKYYAQQAEPGRWLVLRPEKPLPMATKFQVIVGKGAPSAEGPLLTKVDQTFEFTTYGPFKFEDGTCWSDPCRPDSPLVMRFSNSIDGTSFKDAMVRVEPAIEGMQVSVGGNGIQITGKKKSRAQYRVTVEGPLKDTFGQELVGKASHTFSIGDTWPRLQLSREGFVTITPEVPKIDVVSAGQPTVQVAVYKVQPSDWAAFQELQSSLYRNDGPKPPGKLIRQGDVKVAGSVDDLVATPIDLSQALDKGTGNAVVVVSGKRQYRSEVTRVAAWVQVTNLGLDAFSDAGDAVAWVTNLKNGTPVSGATVELLPTKARATTNGDGIAKLALPPLDNDYHKRVMVAHHGDDQVMLPQGTWYKQERSTSYLTWVTDDRGMYKPGETASFKGFVRRLSSAKNATIEAAQMAELRYEVTDPRGSKIAEGVTKLSKLGGFDFTVKLADNVNLGSAYVTFTTADESKSHVANHHFEIQEFRRPEFEVSATVNDGVHIIGQPQSATVKASYYAGGALTGAPVQWTVTSSRASYSPPGRDGYIFGTWRPWWRMYDYYDGGNHLVSTNVVGATDARGTHSIAIEPTSINPSTAVSIEAQASVTDVNRQTWSARASMLVHAATTYVGVKPERMFVEPGKVATFDLVAVDLDGKAEAGRSIHVQVERTAQRVENGVWHTEEVKEADLQVASGATAARWTFTPKEGGTHRMRFEVADAQGRINRTELTLWVSGEKRPSADTVAHDEVTLIPSKQSYSAGDTAEVLVQSPFADASGIVLIERNGVLSTERIQLKDGSAIVKLPIVEAHAPNVHLAVELTGAADVPNSKSKRPAYASGAIDLAVSNAHQALTVEVVPESRGLMPGSTTNVGVVVRDSRGKAVEGAEVALIVVDEAVLALSGFTLRDPLAIMAPHRERDVNNRYLRDSVILARQQNEDDKDEESKEAMADMAAPVMAMMAQAPGAPKAKRSMAGEAPEPAEPQIATRKDFSALAAFVPKLTSDGSGKVTTSVKLPDNLTRYRVMAVAAGSVSQFGKGESTITARLPLMVRPSAPRFLNFGDQFELPAVLHNQTEQAMDVEVVVRAINLEIANPGQRVRVEPGQRVEVRFPARTVAAGTARFQIGAVSGKAADAADVTIKVWTPATTESFATYGVLDGNGVVQQPIAAPADVFPQAGGLKVSTASTALQSLTDAVIYLSNYPYACTEQLSSRVLGLTAMKDVLAAFDADGVPTPKELAASVDSDLAVLATRQAHNGGFGFWDRDRVSPYASIHAAHALLRAKAAGFAVNQQVLDNALGYLRAIEKDLKDYPQAAREVVIAYALAVRARAGDVDSKRASELVAKSGVKKIAVEAAGNLLVVAKRANDNRMNNELVHELERRVTETAASAHFVTHYDDGAHLILASDRRSDAIVLAGLLEAQPASDLVPKVVRGLLDARRHGRWYTTQENVFVLLALGDYFQAFEKQTPEFVARMWLGNDYAGEVPFKGRDTITRELEVPMDKLVSAGRDLILQKEGVGRLYYRIGLDYAPKSLQLAARDAGFQVTRTYEPVDGPDTVKQDADGTWHIKAGARVRVKLEMVAPSVRYHVALVDPMPAGFEAINGALLVSEQVPDESDGDETRPTSRYRGFWWRSQWYEHQNLRDERVEAFGTEVWAGVHKYSYVARATTPGNYVVPPTKAEEMYAPETFGRTASTRVVVE